MKDKYVRLSLGAPNIITFNNFMNDIIIFYQWLMGGLSFTSQSEEDLRKRYMMIFIRTNLFD